MNYLKRLWKTFSSDEAVFLMIVGLIAAVAGVVLALLRWSGPYFLGIPIPEFYGYSRFRLALFATPIYCVILLIAFVVLINQWADRKDAADRACDGEPSDYSVGDFMGEDWRRPFFSIVLLLSIFIAMFWNSAVALGFVVACTILSLFVLFFYSMCRTVKNCREEVSRLSR